MVEPATRGDPESPLRWTSKSTRQLADALTEAGHPASYRTVADLLHRLGYSLQGTAKTRELTSHPDRDLTQRLVLALAHGVHGLAPVPHDVEPVEDDLVGGTRQMGEHRVDIGLPHDQGHRGDRSTLLDAERLEVEMGRASCRER